jgi:hypothetical protein
VAVRTEDTEIRQAVVARISVYVVECERERLTMPGVETADLAPRFLETFAD